MSTWHVPHDLLVRFARESRNLDDTTASSIETHLLRCEECRAMTKSFANTAQIDASWTAVCDVIDRPRRSLVERGLARVFPGHTARILAATPALQLAWFAAVVVIGAVGVMLAHAVGSDMPMVALAPLVPVGGVALVFAPTSDPAGEAALATPAHGAGLVLARTMAVIAVTIPILAVASLFAPAVELRSVAWLLPALGTTTVAIALSTWWAPSTAALTTGAGWLVLVLAVGYAGRAELQAFNEAPFFGWALQLAAVLVVLLATSVSVQRRDRFTALEAR